MSKKSKKKKKQKKPNIPAHTMARPRLEQILIRRQHGELNDEEYVTSIEALMAEIDQEAVLNAMVGLLDNADNERKEALMVAIPKLGNDQTIRHLWQLVRKSRLSVAGKMAALLILKEMGEDVDLEDPGEYFSWRDIKQADLDEVASLGRFSTRAIIKELQQIKDIDEVESMMLRFGEISAQTGGDKMLEVMIDDLVEMGDSGAADMIAAISATTGRPIVREAARQGLSKLAEQNIFPQTPSIKSLLEEHFYAAYCSDPAHPWQQNVTIAFERGKNQVQAMLFLLDFGHPWNGAIKDAFPTKNMTPRQFQREFVDRSDRQGVELRQIPYARARKFVLDALEANRKNKIKLPPEYTDFRPLFERRIVDPSPETLAYAQKVDTTIVDEWGELKGEPVRGMGIIGPDGEPIPVMVFDGDPEDELWDGLGEEIYDLDELLRGVADYYEEVDEALGENQEYILPQEWVVNYLTQRNEQGVDLDELNDYWFDLMDFMAYLDEGFNTPKTLGDIQGYHLSEFITEFWDDNIDDKASIDEKDDAIETVCDLYNYLVAQKHVPGETDLRVAEAADILFGQEDEITLIPRPE